MLVAAVATTAGAALAVALPAVFATARDRPLPWCTFLVLTLILQLFSVEIYGRGSMGVSAIGVLASGYVLGPWPAMAIAVVAAVVQWIARRGLLYKAVFDAGNFALSAGSAAVVYHAVQAVYDFPATALAAAVLSGLVYALANNGLLCLAMSLSEQVSFRAVWNERFDWARLHFAAYGPLALASAMAYENLGVVGVLAFALPPALLLVSVREYLERTRESVEEVRRANRELVEANQELVRMAERVRKTHRDVIAALSRSMEAKDYYTGGHTERVAEISVALAWRLGYRDDDLEAIEIGALLHDIGKIGIPERILNKPGSLDAEEWAAMCAHPVISDQILSAIDLHPFVRQIARSSHERLDGAGYPDGLAGDEVPVPARIVFVADAFDALTTDRPYRRARGALDALTEIRAHAGTQFCPVVVAALESVYRDQPELLGGAAHPLAAVGGHAA